MMFLIQDCRISIVCSFKSFFGIYFSKGCCGVSLVQSTTTWSPPSPPRHKPFFHASLQSLNHYIQSKREMSVIMENTSAQMMTPPRTTDAPQLLSPLHLMTSQRNPTLCHPIRHYLLFCSDDNRNMLQALLRVKHIPYTGPSHTAAPERSTPCCLMPCCLI